MAQLDFLKELQFTTPGIDVQLEFTKPGKGLEKSSAMDPFTRSYAFKAGLDTAVLNITNKGQKGIYVNLIDIDPEDRMNVVLPSIEQPISQCFIKPGESLRLTNVFSQPYGTERLKVIASTRRFDLRPTLNRSGKMRGESGQLKEAFMNDQVSRSADGEGTQEFGTFNIVFEIRK